MSAIHDRLAALIPAMREERRTLVREHGGVQVSSVSVKQILGGMRDVDALVCDTSEVDPTRGLIIRGIPVAHLAGRAPEDVLFLLLTGSLPSAAEAQDLHRELAKRAGLPPYVWRVIEAMPPQSHPMTLFSAAILALEKESEFTARYNRGLAKDDAWKPALDDALDLIARVPEVAAGIYRIRYWKGPRISRAPDLDWAAGFAHMLGYDDDGFRAYLRLATVVQSDHEGAHASALTAHTVGSVLSNVYLAASSAMNALAGPLHGLASQVCLEWVLAAIDRYNGQPSDEEIREYASESIRAGRVIPGYGHAVLRGQDPRYLAILAFGEKECPRDRVFKTVVAMSRVIPSVLIEEGKAKNPWPNVDAINGSVFYHYGITEIPFYTVFFGAALTLGIASQYVLNRALGTPITRPRSISTQRIRTLVSGEQGPDR
jgi:citrate synthase